MKAQLKFLYCHSFIILHLSKQDDLSRIIESIEKNYFLKNDKRKWQIYFQCFMVFSHLPKFWRCENLLRHRFKPVIWKRGRSWCIHIHDSYFSKGKATNKRDLSRRGEAKIITEHFTSVKLAVVRGRRKLWIMYIHYISSLRRN